MARERCTRRQITQPVSWWNAFMEQAAKENMSLSEWIGECCRAYVPVDLPDRPPPHRPWSYDK